MEDSLKSPALASIGKDHPAQGGPVTMPGRIDYLVAKACRNFIQRRLPGCDDFSGNDVGIDDRDAEFGKHLGNQGFAAGNAAGQTDAKWGLSGRASHSEQYV